MLGVILGYLYRRKLWVNEVADQVLSGVSFDSVKDGKLEGAGPGEVGTLDY